MKVSYTGFGVFRYAPYWMIAFGDLAGGNALATKTSCLVTDVGLRKFHLALMAVREITQTNPPASVQVPLIEPPTYIPYRALQNMIEKVAYWIARLDAGQPIGDSEEIQTGGCN